MHRKSVYDMIITGAGPAGLTAGIYAARARMKVLILDEGIVGGQLILTHEIANFPGVESTSGFMLASTMKKQAESFGCEIRTSIRIREIDVNGIEKKIILENGEELVSKTIILTPGGRPRMLNIPGEEKFKGRGVSYCATCDGDFFQNKKIVVVGGGNSALEEAVSLTKYASEVVIVHQFDHFQAFEHAINEAKNHPKISIILVSELREISGDSALKNVRIENLKTKEQTVIETDGVFIFIGYVPNTEWLHGIVTLNRKGEIIVDKHMRTNIPGVFAAGDCIEKDFRQVTLAVGEGTVAALAATDYLHAK